MFDVVKIKEDKLNMLYQFDSALITLVEETNTLFGELETNSNANTDIKDSVFKISYSLDNLLLKFDERENLLRAFN
jgi:DNA-dependent RNA polymerase auxiliary subunit epsilon